MNLPTPHEQTAIVSSLLYPPRMNTESNYGATLVLSVVAPAHNEEDNVAPLVKEVGEACKSMESQLREFASTLGVSLSTNELPYEFILVDDGSIDATQSKAAELVEANPWLRIVSMTQTPPNSGGGQSAAFHAGFRSARGALIGVLDADLQNDPADFPKMIELMKQQAADMVQGDRSQNRKDNAMRRFTSRVGRWFRAMILGDSIRDTGCSLRIMKREIAVSIPLQFKGMHRFIPVSARHMGFKVIEMPVSHRPRVAGEPKYGSMGITKRALPGLIDCFAVRWMSKRRRPVAHAEITPEHTK